MRHLRFVRSSVDTAAPVIPSSGNGPKPKMKHGSSTRLIRFDIHSTRIASEASPAPLKIALFRNSSITTTLLPRTIAV